MTLPHERFPDVLICLTRGAGLLLTPGMNEEEQVRLVLEEAIRDPQSGEWESEIALLVRDQKWTELKRVADGLRAQQPHLCLRCWGSWYGKPKPITCPKCRSPYWNKPRRTPRR